MELFGFPVTDEDCNKLITAAISDHDHHHDDVASSCSTNKSYDCKLCERRFETHQGLGGHQNAHRAERDFAKSLALLRRQSRHSFFDQPAPDHHDDHYYYYYYYNYYNNFPNIPTPPAPIIFNNNNNNIDQDDDNDDDDDHNIINDNSNLSDHLLAIGMGTSTAGQVGPQKQQLMDLPGNVQFAHDHHQDKEGNVGDLVDLHLRLGPPI